MSTPDAGYDPVPALAAIVDGIRAMARDGTDEGIQAQLKNLLLGPYISLRAGLELDGPDWDQASAEYAIRNAVLAIVRWAPYQEFGIPDPARETDSPPVVPFTVGSTGFRGYTVIIYWEAAVPGIPEARGG